LRYCSFLDRPEIYALLPEHTRLALTQLAWPIMDIISQHRIRHTIQRHILSRPLRRSL
jgi:hypothetical protein